MILILLVLKSEFRLGHCYNSNSNCLNSKPTWFMNKLSSNLNAFVNKSYHFQIQISEFQIFVKLITFNGSNMSGAGVYKDFISSSYKIKPCLAYISNNYN